jgi:glycine dehydrogenase subunit 1
MVPYIPHTEEEISRMLEQIGIKSIEDLFADIPDALKFNQSLNLPESMDEYSLFTHIQSLAEKNDHGIMFMGGGSYDHSLPSAAPFLAGRSEFATAYTPYQAEISQGILEAIFEFQTMVCELSGLEVSNASLYDGSTAAAEACGIAIQTNRKRGTILVSDTVHPHTIQAIRTQFLGQDFTIKTVKSHDGSVLLENLEKALDEDTLLFMSQSPNVFGVVEDYSGFADLLHENKSLFVISQDPLASTILKTPGEWGADIAVGDMQPFGIPMTYGGPSVGYIAARSVLLRKMPGRIVGETLDSEGKRAFVLTLQAREQHIKRERATSNICSNQALAALQTAITCALFGPEGSKAMARSSYSGAEYLQKNLCKLPSVSLKYEKPFFREFAISLPISAELFVEQMKDKGIFAGIPLSRFQHAEFDEKDLLIAVTEKRNKAELDTYLSCAKEILQ